MKVPKAVDLRGQRFGRLVAIEPTEERRNGGVVWKCKCDCGNEHFTTVKILKEEKPRSCGCSRIKDLKGQRFGRLVVVEKSDTKNGANEEWICNCDCGNQVKVISGSLVSGSTRSCGCLNAETGRESWIKNDLANIQRYKGTRIYALTKRMQRNNTTGVKGVWFDKRSSKYAAEIKLQGRKYGLGSYEKLEDAAEARKQAEEELFHPIIEEYENLTKE